VRPSPIPAAPASWECADTAARHDHRITPSLGDGITAALHTPPPAVVITQRCGHTDTLTSGHRIAASPGDRITVAPWHHIIRSLRPWITRSLRDDVTE